MARERRAKKRKEQQLRTGYVRPSRAKPKTGWTLAELAQMTVMRERLLKRWLEMEIVPRPPFHGVATRYSATRRDFGVSAPADPPNRAMLHQEACG